jgi:hypothetical protein
MKSNTYQKLLKKRLYEQWEALLNKGLDQARAYELLFQAITNVTREP